MLLVEEFSVLLIGSADGFQIVGKALEKHLDHSLVLGVEVLVELLDVHWQRLLEVLHIRRLTHSDEQVLEGLQSELPDGFVVLEGHVSSDDWQEGFDVGCESGAHVLADLEDDGKGAKLALISIRVH